jgi:signal transduction histidine kinase
MNNSKYKTKRFIFPLLSFVLILILSISAIGGYITISLFKKHMNEHIEQTKKEYIHQHKNKVYNEVNFVNDSIKFQITKIENKLKKSLKEKIQIALDVATFTYEKYKDTHNKEEIKEKIAKALAVIKFNDNRGYYFMYDNKTKIIFGHPLKKFIGKNMTNFKDIRGQSLMELDIKALQKDKIGFSEIYFNKPDNQNEEFPKITCVTKFEPLNLVLGIGEYRDIVEQETKDYIIERFSQPKYHKKDKYLVILDVHNKKGGDDFATVLLNSNRTELVGKKVSDKDKDFKGNRFRKDFLDLVVEKGEGFSTYWYQKPSTNLPAEKISYFYLQKDWNWIIASGFYFDDLEEQINTMENQITSHVNDTIKNILIWVSLLSALAILIAIIVSLQIDKTIRNYTNQIIDYENNKREKEKLLIQQSKMATMGEMLGSITHQWKQPLSVLSMSSGMIRLSKEEKDLFTDKQIDDSLNSIDHAINNINQTIDDFKNFFNPNKERTLFLISDAVDETFKLISTQFKNNTIEIIKNINEVHLYGSQNELQQVFINLLKNAKEKLIKKSSNEKRLLFIDVSQDNRNAIIKIKDNANGIPEDIIDKVFDSYFTTKENEGGSGIGLYMSKQIIEESMKGSITVENKEFNHDNIDYKGAEFTILIPIDLREDKI